MINYVELRLFTDAAHTQYVVLPDFSNLSFDKKYNDIGAISFEYPSVQAQALGLTDQDFIGVRVGYSDGTTKDVEQYVIESTDDDKVVDDTRMRTLSGRAKFAVLDDAVVYPSNWPVTSPSGHDFVAATPGTIWRTLIQRAKTRGTFPQLVETSFSGTQDTNGATWLASLSQTFSNGTTYTQALQDMMDRGLVDARMVGWNLQIYNGTTLGNHIAIGSLEVRPASNVTEMSTSTNSSESCSSVLIEGEEGTSLERSNTSALTLIGRRRERYVTQGGIADAGILAILGDAELSQYARIPTEETVGIVDSDNLEAFKDFDVADWVWVRYETTDAPVERRIQQIAVAVDSNRGMTIGITLNSILAEEDVKLRRKVDAYTGSGGTYGSTPNTTDDFTIPNAPTGVGVTSTTFLSNQGVYTGAINVTWAAPSTNTNGSSLTDLDHYDIQYRYTSGSDTDWKAVFRTSGNETLIGYSPVTPGRAIEVRVRAVDSSDHPSAFTTPVAHTVVTDTTPPPIPSTPVAASLSRAIKVGWDGKTNTVGVSMPQDLGYVELWASATNAFTPGAAGSSQIGTFNPGGGEFLYNTAIMGQPYYFRLVAVDKAGNKSAASAVSNAASAVGDGQVPTNSPTTVALAPLGIMALNATWSAVINADPVTYDVYISTTNNFTTFNSTTLAGSTGATSMAIDRLPNGADLQPGITYYVKVRARDADGLAATVSPQGSGSTKIATAKEISADYVYAGDLSANQIETGIANADIVVSGRFLTADTGQRVVIDRDGIAWFASSDTAIPSTFLPTDPNQRARIGNADIDVKNATVADGLSIQKPESSDDGARLEVGANLRMTVGVRSPQTSPSVQVNWAKTSYSGLAVIGAQAYTLGFHKNATYAYFSYRSGTYDSDNAGWNNRVARFPIAGGAPTIIAPRGFASDYLGSDIMDLCAGPAGTTNLYGVVKSSDGMYWEVNLYDASLNYLSNVFSTGSSAAYPSLYPGTSGSIQTFVPTGLYYDGTYVWVIGAHITDTSGSGGNRPPDGYANVGLLRIAVTGGALTKYTSTIPVSGKFLAYYYYDNTQGYYNGDLRFGLYVGNADFGAQRVVFGYNDNAGGNPREVVCSIGTTTITEVTTASFPAGGGGNAQALTYDSTTSAFYSTANFDLSNGGVSFYTHTGNTWTTESSLWWVAHQWRKNSPTYNTAPGPKTSITMLKRARLSISSTAIPVYGTTSDPDQVAFFVGRGATAPATTAMFQQGTPSSSRSVLVTAATFTGVTASATNTFPVSGAALIQSSDSTSIVLSGDGTGTTGPLSWAWDTNGTTFTGRVLTGSKIKSDQPFATAGWSMAGDGSGKAGPLAWDATGKPTSNALANQAANVNLSTTNTFVLQASLAVVNGRSYRVIANGEVQNATAGSNTRMHLHADGVSGGTTGTTLRTHGVDHRVASTPMGYTMMGVYTATATSTIFFKLTGLASSGTSVALLGADLSVECIG